MAHMTDAMEVTINAYLTKGTAPPALTAPIRITLLSALGTGDAAGTPITGGTTPIKDLGATGTNPTSNGTVLRWEGLPNPTTVAGYRVQDSAATPTIILDNVPRTGGSVSVTDGIFEIPAGGFTNTTD
jgi:hypothetical protein